LSTTMPSAGDGSSGNPWPANNGWKGAGYYDFSKVPGGMNMFPNVLMANSQAQLGAEISIAAGTVAT
jgi:hypothetical protein